MKIEDVLIRVVKLMDVLNISGLSICSPLNEFLNPDDDPVECNIVRGRMLRIEKIDKNIYKVVEFYSHTTTDCPDCDPNEIEKLDKESEKVIGIFKLVNNKIVWL